MCLTKPLVAQLDGLSNIDKVDSLLYARLVCQTYEVMSAHGFSEETLIALARSCRQLRESCLTARFHLRDWGIYTNTPDFVIPVGVTRLSFCNRFNQPVDNLPAKLTHLDFGWHFNQPVDNLPVSLAHLGFGNKFNKPVDNLHVNLTHLNLGWNFNQLVDKLPAKLTHLTLSHEFDHPLNNLPDHLVYICVGGVCID